MGGFTPPSMRRISNLQVAQRENSPIQAGLRSHPCDGTEGGCVESTGAFSLSDELTVVSNTGALGAEVGFRYWRWPEEPEGGELG